jgi:hypothetical protein
MDPRVRKILIVAAEVLLVVVILALIAANWIPIVVGAHPTRGSAASPY